MEVFNLEVGTAAFPDVIDDFGVSKLALIS
jgi:hypothetical protein